MLQKIVKDTLYFIATFILLYYTWNQTLTRKAKDDEQGLCGNV